MIKHVYQLRKNNKCLTAIKIQQCKRSAHSQPKNVNNKNKTLNSKFKLNLIHINLK